MGQSRRSVVAASVDGLRFVLVGTLGLASVTYFLVALVDRAYIASLRDTWLASRLLELAGAFITQISNWLGIEQLLQLQGISAIILALSLAAFAMFVNYALRAVSLRITRKLRVGMLPEPIHAEHVFRKG